MNTHLEIRGQIAVITLDYPPVNGIGSALRTGLEAALHRALVDARVGAVVVTGTGRAFSAGADVKEFGTEAATREPLLAALIAAFEDAPKPVIAAISGLCLGGGLELALGAHYRVANAEARIGLPEVKLGLIPGAGGTQRLPRAIGLEAGLSAIVSGESVPAGQFRGTPLFDVITDSDAVCAAVTLGEQIITDARPRKRLRDIEIMHPQGRQLIGEARRRVTAGGPRQAMLQCVEAVGWCLEKPFDEALEMERAAFMRLMTTPESRALRHAFAAERAAARVEGVPAGASTRHIGSAGVVGAGTMGAGIAMALANAAIPVVLIETSPEALARGLSTIRRNYENSASKGKLSVVQVEERLALITPTLDYSRLADVDLVIEAAFEDIGVKEAVFRKLDAVCKPGAILASNTSYLNVDRIAAFTDRPQNVLGLHFFSPANVMRLLEIVRGAQTAPEVLGACLALARRMNKVGVVAGVCDGFIGNRMVFRYTAAAFGLVGVGASPQQVDDALQTFGMAMGPLRMGDLAGLDISWATRKRKASEAGETGRPVIPDKLCEAGRFGQKTGAGWYRYDDGRRDPIPDPAVEQLIAKYRQTHGITRRKVSNQEIVQRCIFSLVNEGARILAEGIAARASDIDLVYLNGYGFPSYRGGPMLYADMVGLPEVVKALKGFADEEGAPAWWEPAPLLLKLAAQGKTFN